MRLCRPCINYECLFYQKNSFGTSVKFMLYKIVLWKCTSNRAYSLFFPIVDLRDVFKHFKTEEMLSCLGFGAFESKSSLTIFPTSLNKKLLFRDICWKFLIMVLITIVSLSLSSNKLGNNFNCDTNLLIPMSSLLILNKKVLSCNWLATNNNFWYHQELKMGISGAFF